MITLHFLLVIFAATSVESITCPAGQQPCGSVWCYDPTIQGCVNGGTSIQCINSCNGTCYSNSQYCYNNTKVCNNMESVCDIKTINYLTYLPLGLTCYNSSQYVCSNTTLCYSQYSCGTQCLTDYSSVCVNNRTICPGFDYFSYYPNSNRYVNVCGTQQRCYDNATSVCLNGTTLCQGLNAQFCGSNCFNPDRQTCINGTVRCINSCNGTCYSNSQYCYNNTKVCNNMESVCDIKTINYLTYLPLGLTCYNSSQYVCSNTTLCYSQYSRGTQCLTDYSSVCVNNRTICPGFDYFSYYPNSNRYVNVCGTQQRCYDNATSVCLTELLFCFNSDRQTCINGTVRCINSCNGTCYSNSQYCYNNTKICNSMESVCDIKTINYLTYLPLGLTCYNSSQYVCSNNTLCASQYSCGTQCLTDYNSVCANNRTICSGFYFYNYYPYSNRYVNVCGTQQRCYDNTTSVCLGNNGTICPIGSQLCSGVCYNPQSQYCIGGNNTIYCLSNPSSSSCPSTPTNALTTTATPATTTSGNCCAVQNCTTNSDCCQVSSLECQCYRHSPTDIYGSCANPNITPICDGSCAVQGRCREDSDCCKCQCAEIKFTDSSGQLITKKQCIRR